jgi:NTP pyrophosphatase (non-canonical NTP hydrolase)
MSDGTSQDRDPKAYEEARDRFSIFAAMDAPELPDDEFDALQVRLCRWQGNKFGAQPWELMTFGIVEEMGELDDAIEVDDKAEIFDAVGDICVYASQILTHNRLALVTALREANLHTSPPRMMSAAGKLCHVTLKRLQRIRGMQDVEAFRAALFEAVVNVLAAARAMGWPLAQSLVDTAEEVMTRSGDMHPESAA